MKVRADARPRPSEPGLAVDRHRLVVRDAFHVGHDRVEDVRRRTAPVEVVMLDMSHPRADEVSLVVTSLVQSDDQADIATSKVRDVIRGSEHAESFRSHGAGGLWTREGRDLPRHDPVQVPVLDLLEVLVFVDVEVDGERGGSVSTA